METPLLIFGFEAYHWLRKNHSGMETKQFIDGIIFIYSCVRTIVVWKHMISEYSERTESPCCVRTIVVWKRHRKHFFSRFIDVGCVRTIVVWKQSTTQGSRPLPLTLRKNHSGMETRIGLLKPKTAAQCCVRTIVVWIAAFGRTLCREDHPGKWCAEEHRRTQCPEKHPGTHGWLRQEGKPF